MTEHQGPVNGSPPLLPLLRDDPALEPKRHPRVTIHSAATGSAAWLNEKLGPIEPGFCWVGTPWVGWHPYYSLTQTAHASTSTQLPNPPGDSVIDTHSPA